MATAAAVPSIGLPSPAQSRPVGPPLISWNEGQARAAILDFVRTTTDKASDNFVVPEDRIATFDQDGTLWVEHPIYAQAMFAMDRVHTLAPPMRTAISVNFQPTGNGKAAITAHGLSGRFPPKADDGLS